VIRAAVLTSYPALGVLVEHASVYPVRADVSWEFKRQGAEAEYSFTWHTHHFRRTRPTLPLLGTVLPHHVDSLVHPEDLYESIAWRTIKGDALAIKANVWRFAEKLTQIDFTAPHALKYAPDDWKQALMRSLEEDMTPQVGSIASAATAVAELSVVCGGRRVRSTRPESWSIRSGSTRTDSAKRPHGSRDSCSLPTKQATRH
jgi:hypothetical protein